MDGLGVMDSDPYGSMNYMNAQHGMAPQMPPMTEAQPTGEYEVSTVTDPRFCVLMSQATAIFDFFIIAAAAAS